MDWRFEPKMEDMTDAEIAERIRAAYAYEIPAKLRPIPYIGDKNALISYSSDELTARCPVTGYIDLYKVKFQFLPDEIIPELKSLKLYLMAYGDLPISHEHLASKLYHDFGDAVAPRELKVTLDVAVRGGISTEIVLGSLA